MVYNSQLNAEFDQIVAKINALVYENETVEVEALPGIRGGLT